MNRFESELREALVRQAPESLDRDIDRLIETHRRAGRPGWRAALLRVLLISVALGTGFLFGRWHGDRDRGAGGPVVVTTSLSSDMARLLDLSATKEAPGLFEREWGSVSPTPTRSVR